MAYRVLWTKIALTDLGNLVRFIASDNPGAAERFGNLIVSKAQRLGTFPRIGRMVRGKHDDLLREIIVSPYRVVYKIHDESAAISIVRIWHGARGDLELPFAP